MTGMMDSGETN